MSESTGTQGDAATAGHSAGEPDQLDTDGSHANTGSDVGGPATTNESAAERAVTGTGSVGTEDDSGDQATEPS